MHCAPSLLLGRSARSTFAFPSLTHSPRRMASPSPSYPKFEFEAAPWLSNFGLSVFSEFSPLALRQNAINLGQGFPNFEPPEILLEAAQLAQRGQTPGIATPGAALINQYARPGGHLRLVKALAKLYSPILGRDLDPLTQILVTVGASEGLFSGINGLVSPGDEVIAITPFFDIYEGAIARAGAKLVQVPLILMSDAKNAGEFKLDMAALKRAMSPKTRAVILNTPHNPTGKVFSRAELEEIAAVIKTNPRTMVIADEVYEFLVYPDVDSEGQRNEMARMCLVDGMWERTLNVSSIAKSMSCTGYKVGWVYGPANLVDAAARTHQFISYAVVTNLQEAVAVALEKAETNGYWKQLAAEYLHRREVLMTALRSAGFNPIVPQGTFFVTCDVSSEVKRLPQGWGMRPHETVTRECFDLVDWNFCRWLTAEVGVAAIPCSAFYSGPTHTRPTNIIRFAFCKREDDMKEAAKRLQKLPTMLPKA